MKNIFKFFGIFLTVLFGMAMTGCISEDELQSADVGLHIKVFFPTKVVAGQPMTINGCGFSDATEIVFPEGVTVTDFQIVSNDMIRVNAPAGIAAEGGHIVVRTAEEEVESPLPLTLGNTVISGYSAEEGVVVDGGTQMTIYGTDLEFVSRIEMLDKDSNPIFVEDKVFNRKGTSSIIFTVPKNVFEGEFEGKVYTIDGKTFTMPNLTYKPASDGGHLEIVETILWENPDPDGVGSVSWSGQYRFGLEGTDGNNECITTFPAETWDIIKNGTFILKFAPAADAYQIRATTGWWSFDGDGAYDIHGGDERIVDNGDGTFSLTYTISEEPLKSGIYDLIDSQHLLFTGSGYTPLKIVITEEVWVPGGSVEIVRTSIWKNDDPAGNGETGWGSKYRFCLEGRDANNECIAEIPADIWEKMKAETFYLHFQGSDWVDMKVTSGWWQNDWTGANIQTGNERFVDNGDGTFTLAINFEGDPILDVLDEQHLLFTGGGYTPLELYFEEEVVTGGGATPTEVVVWEGEEDLGAWSLNLEIKPNDMFVTNPVSAGQTLRFYVTPTADWWQMQLFNGHWEGMVLPESSAGNNNVNAGDTTISEDGYISITVTDIMVEDFNTKIDWGYSMVVQGESLILTKISFI